MEGSLWLIFYCIGGLSDLEDPSWLNGTFLGKLGYRSVSVCAFFFKYILHIFKVLFFFTMLSEHFYCDKGINYLENVFSTILLMVFNRCASETQDWQFSPQRTFSSKCWWCYNCWIEALTESDAENNENYHKALMKLDSKSLWLNTSL